MGLYSWLFPTTPLATAPDRSQREICWAARDAYFACLDGNKVLPPGAEGANVCAEEKKSYGGSCAKSWIEYFNKRRILQEEQKDVLAVAAAQATDASRKR